MAVQFSCTVKYFQVRKKNKQVKFHSIDGTEYSVKFSSNVSKDLILKIEWNFLEHILVVAEVYTDAFTNCISSRGKYCTGIFVELILPDIFNTCSNINYAYLCRISVTPHLALQNIPDPKKPSLKGHLVDNVWPVTEIRHENLSFDLQNLLTRNDLSDVIVTNGSIEIMAHKVILSMRSQVFDKMFQHNLKENIENQIMIPDVSPDVLKALINFIYTGAVEITDFEMAQDLYILADKYDIKDLRSLCSSLMGNKLTINCVLDTFIVAQLCQDCDLKKTAMEFIVKNFTCLKADESWSRFAKAHGDSMAEILDFVMEKKL